MMLTKEFENWDALPETLKQLYPETLAFYGNHPLLLDNEAGVLRFKPRPVIQYICNKIPDIMTAINLEVQLGHIPEEDVKQLYRDIGYDLEGFIEIFGDEFENEGK